MSANVDYSDFNVSTFNDTESGAHFIWDGEFFCFFGEEQVVPVDVNIEVTRRQN